MSDRAASKGTRSSGLGEVPSRAPFSTRCSSAQNLIGLVQHVDEVATRKGRRTVSARPIEIDESMVAIQGDAGVT